VGYAYRNLVTPKTKRNFGVDLARTVAVIGVIEVHTFHWIPGAYGVPLFFVISGYLLSDKSRLMSNRQFLVTRWARLWPLAFIMTAFYSTRFNSFIEVTVTLSLLHIFFLGQQSFPGSWSISSEWLYAIANIFLVKFVRTIRLKIFFGTFIFLVVVDVFRHNVHGIEQEWFYGSLLLISNFSYFVAGNLLHEKSLTIIPSSIIVAIVLAILIVSVNNNVYDSFYCPAVILFFVVCLRAKTGCQFLQKIVHYVGKRTYSLFCSHFLLISLSQTLGFYSLESQNIRANRILYFLVILLFSLLISHFSYTLIEKPTLRLIVRKLQEDLRRL
jgi:peptidoglycan/LPS O-acetylase OafA/YrhL